MSTDGAEETLQRLRDLLSGRVQVVSEVFPRVVQALVRRAGPEGFQTFGLRLVREPDPRRAETLIRMSVQVLGERAVPFLVQGIARPTDPQRALRTVEVLGTIDAPSAHEALREIEGRYPQAQIREAAAAQRHRLEEAHATRYRLLPRLMAAEIPPAEVDRLAREMLSTGDAELVTLLIKGWDSLCEAGKQIALCALEDKGDPKAAAFFQARLEAGKEEALLAPLCRALVPILTRHPDQVRGYEPAWIRLFREHGSDRDLAEGAARVLSLNPEPRDSELYVEFLQSPFEMARLSGLRALARAPTAAALPAVRRCLSSESAPERAAALSVLAALGEGSAVDEWAATPEAARRRTAARVCLSLGRRDLWVALASDSEPLVAQEALDALDQIPPQQAPTLREAEEVLRGKPLPFVVQHLCRVLGARGDRDTASAVIARLGSERSLVPAIFQALRELRLRDAYTWGSLAQEDQSALETALSGEELGHASAELILCLAQDLPAEVLSRLRDVLKSQIDWKRRDSNAAQARPQGIEAAYLAVLERLRARETVRKLEHEVEQALAAHPNAVSERTQAALTVARVWLREDLDLDPALAGRIEERLTQVTEDESAQILARKEAVAALGKRGSLASLPAVVRLRANTNEALSAAAAEAFQNLAARHPAEQIGQASLAGAVDAPCVLVVDDEELVRALYGRFLAQKGFQTFSAADGIEALRFIDENPVDVLLLDIEMPRFDGYAVLEALQKRRRRPRVLVSTSHGDQRTVVRALGLGAEDFLRKPVDLEQLLSRVNRLLNR